MELLIVPPTPPMAPMAAKIVAAVGPDRRYIFPPEIVAIGYYTVENAKTWLEVDKFMRWLGHQAQSSATTPPTTPATHSSSSRPLSPTTSSSGLPSLSFPTWGIQRGAQASQEEAGEIDRENMCEITKQFRVSEIHDIFEIPLSGWTTPRKDAGEDFAYRRDLTGDPREWVYAKKELRSMAAIVKLEVYVSRVAWL
ncbi:hypothetical protein K438DRAFT_1775698 [Mycena galopus ATCC 62051]|nr:hypothetical protein K438DRAFT_1775698 [Mycena galopus ATCC 62051]